MCTSKYKDINLNSLVPLDKKLFDNSIFWSATHGQLFTIEKIILTVLSNNPCYENIIKLIVNFGLKTVKKAIELNKEILFASDNITNIEEHIVFYEENINKAITELVNEKENNWITRQN